MTFFPLMHYVAEDVDRRRYYLCGKINPQLSAVLASTASLMMYLAIIIYICSTGYWYIFTTLFIGVIYWSEYITGCLHIRKSLLDSFMTFMMFFELAIAGLLGTFIYFTVASDDNDTEYGVMVGVLSLFFVLNAISIRIVIRFSNFVLIYSHLITQSLSQIDSSERSSSPSSSEKETPKSTLSGSILTSIPIKEDSSETVGSVDHNHDNTNNNIDSNNNNNNNNTVLTINIGNKVNPKPQEQITTAQGPFEASVPVSVPIWIAVHFKKRRKCQIVAPDWLSVDKLKEMIKNENDSLRLTPIPNCFMEIAHILIDNAKDDLDDVDQVIINTLKTYVQDLW
ncbi:unnamed protein product, partial [Anisakis simplex]|uniref:GINS complex subunit 2 n=1 Tax=Anisakis simplex TaxID=6269 RepID=A0A0M3K611_ANISI